MQGVNFGVIYINFSILVSRIVEAMPITRSLSPEQRPAVSKCQLRKLFRIFNRRKNFTNPTTRQSPQLMNSSTQTDLATLQDAATQTDNSTRVQNLNSVSVLQAPMGWKLILCRNDSDGLREVQPTDSYWVALPENLADPALGVYQS